MLDFINHPSVAIINVLADADGSPFSCSDWGIAGQLDFPLIIDDEIDYVRNIGAWFGVSYSSPRNIFIDHNFNYYTITQDINQVEVILEEMLENME